MALNLQARRNAGLIHSLKGAESRAMKRYYIFKDGTQVGSTVTRETAIDLIRQYQKQETHYLLRSAYSMIAGEEEFIPYPSQREPAKRKRQPER